jgi:hypothetical protein
MGNAYNSNKLLDDLFDRIFTHFEFARRVLKKSPGLPAARLPDGQGRHGIST